MIISLPILIYITVLLVLALATPFLSPFLYKVREEKEVTEQDGEEEAGTLPPVSIVLTGHDCSYQLAQVLPKFLEQDYPADWQVIVVIDRSDSDAEDVLKRYSDNPHLYYTMLPDTSRYLSRKKLGLTLGMRAARHDWVLVTDTHSIPSSDKWLASMAAHSSEDRNMVLGMALYGDDTSSYYRYEQLRITHCCLLLAQRSRPVITNQPVVMMRKSEFFEQGGFIGNLEYTRAEFEFLVNKFGKKGICAVAIEPEARMIGMKPSKKRRVMHQLYAINATRDLKRMLLFRLTNGLDLYGTLLYNMLTLLGFMMTSLTRSGMESLTLCASCIVLWLLSQCIRYAIYRPTLRYYNSVNPLKAILFEWIMPWYIIVLIFKHAFSNKNDFITHKL